MFGRLCKFRVFLCEHPPWELCWQGTGDPVEDRVLNQQPSKDRRVSRPDAEGSAQSADSEFPLLLRTLRDQRGLSKADLAKRTGYDPSTITRFEQGSRAPDRESVLHLADSMVLPLIDRDRLLAAAGFRSVIWDDPLLVELAQALVDPTVPGDVKLELRSVIRMAITYSHQRRSG
jgi:transcriptional regulator with XRE-family HTH domain